MTRTEGRRFLMRDTMREIAVWFQEDPAGASGRREARDLAAAQQEAAKTEVFEVGHAVGGHRLAVGRLLACPLHVPEESVAVNRIGDHRVPRLDHDRQVCRRGQNSLSYA